VEMGIWKYSDEKISAATNIIATIVSATLPASSMIVLFCVNSIAVKLAIVVVYNIGFSFVLRFLVRAKNVEVFATVTA
jgi:hypothetical protein